MATTNVPESLPLVDNNNPLRQYRSYSYHFFMIAAESTEVLNYLQVANASAFERPPGDPRQTIPANKNGTPVGNYVIVIDTRHDVDFILDDVQWGTTFLGEPNGSNSTLPLNTVMTDGVITVLEPRGVNFLNVLANLGDQLDVDMICMPYMLKVIFYGHLEDGTVIPLSNVQPFGFIPVDITGSVDERGTIYKLDICGIVNGIGYNPSYNAIVDNVGFTITPKPLVNVLADISAQLNDVYKKQRNQVITNYPTFENSATINYQIVLEDNSQVLQTLTDFGTNTPGQVSATNSSFTVTGTKEGGIAEVILKVLQSSKVWMTTAAEGSPPNITNPDNVNKRYTFKVTSEFEKTSSSLGQNVVTVKIYVSEYRYETIDVISTAGGSRAVQQAPNVPANQVVVFDYIFTGKNLDILHMDLNLTMGLALLQTLATAKALQDQLSDVTGGPASKPSTVAAAAASSGGFNRHGVVRKGTPVFAPLQWQKDFQKELNSIQETATADAVWSSFAGYQSINTNMTIHGNPLLLGRLVDPDRSVPNYVKVNIKMPSTTDDIWEYNQSGNSSPGGYYKDFWFNGYYLMLSAANKFNGGMFTQELELISMPQVSSAQGQGASSESSQSQNVTGENFFNPQTSQSTPVSTTTPTNDTTSQSSTTGSIAHPSGKSLSGDPQAFVATYWNYALQASQQSGIDPDFLLAQAALETGYGHNTLTQYSNFFSQKSFGKPNNFWTGDITLMPRTTDKPYRAYDGPTNGFLDQARTLRNVYPQSASAPPGPSGINQFAFGLQNGTGGRKFAEDPLYPSKVIATYNQIQTIKANLGIVPNQYFGALPTTPGNAKPYLAQNVSTSSGSTSTEQTAAQFATNRSVAQASIDQKKPRTA